MTERMNYGSCRWTQMGINAQPYDHRTTIGSFLPRCGPTLLAGGPLNMIKRAVIEINCDID
jgi:hypothetical protein